MPPKRRLRYDDADDASVMEICSIPARFGQGVCMPNFRRLSASASPHDGAGHAMDKSSSDRVEAHVRLMVNRKERHQECHQHLTSFPVPTHTMNREQWRFSGITCETTIHRVKAFRRSRSKDQSTATKCADERKTESEHCEVKLRPQVRKHEIMALCHRRDTARAAPYDPADFPNVLTLICQAQMSAVTRIGHPILGCALCNVIPQARLDGLAEQKMANPRLNANSSSSVTAMGRGRERSIGARR